MIEIPGYTILGQIGRGGMATVFRARQVLLDREVALKVMSPQLAQDPVYAQRFLQEARMLAQLNHPHVVPVYDIGVTPEGLHYFSMQLLNGGDFVHRMREGLSEQELVRVLVAVGNALGFAHARGYVHRDVTPANILFDTHDTPVLTDFGIARAVSSASRITASGLSIGTSHYMSPEQARGIEVDHRSDIYSLGVLCYEALEGHPPFNGEDGFAVAFAHVHDPIPRLPEEVARWQPLIDRAMAKEPSQRYPDCAAFIDGLRLVAPEEFKALAPAAPVAAAAIKRTTPPPANVSATVPPVNGSHAAPPRRKGLLIGLAVAGVAGIGLITAGLMLSGDEPGASIRTTSATAPVQTPPKPTVPTTSTTTPSNPPTTTPSTDGTDPLATTDNPDPTADPSAVVDPTLDPTLDPNAPPAENLPEHTVNDPVVTLIGMGRANIAAGRLVAPPSPNNALERFQLALVIEKDNKEAAQGIASVAQAFLDRATKLDADADAAGWLAAITQAETVAAKHPVAQPKAVEARKLREARAAALVERGRAALPDWDAMAAQAAFEEALRVMPGLDAAEQGLREAAKVGKVGYAFEDPIQSGGRGPAMVVVSDALALSRHEVTVGDFRRFWSQPEAQKLKSGMPGCRDREGTKLFSESRKRTWQAPDVEQGDRNPVVCISYPMAEAYAAWVSARTGKKYRIPKASELAAYAKLDGQCTANVRDASYRQAKGGRGGATCDDGYAGTAPVGSFKARSPGLFDTDGNVREWTQDCSGGCANRVALGRSWNSEPADPDRDSFVADTGFNTIGFRLAREID